MDVILFLIFAIIAVVCAINVVVQTHPISSAISLVILGGRELWFSFTASRLTQRNDGDAGKSRDQTS